MRLLANKLPMNYSSKIKSYLRFSIVLKVSILTEMRIVLTIWNNHRNKYMYIYIYNASIFIFIHI